MIILLFGQPGSGKTTLSNAIVENYEANFIQIDGDKWRAVCKNTAYDREGRVYNLKTAFNAALYLEKENFVVLLSFVTPYQELRDYLKENADDFLQVYLKYDCNRGKDDYFVTDFEIPDEEDATLINIVTDIVSVDQSLGLIYNQISNIQNAG